MGTALYSAVKQSLLDRPDEWQEDYDTPIGWSGKALSNQKLRIVIYLGNAWFGYGAATTRNIFERRDFHDLIPALGGRAAIAELTKLAHKMHVRVKQRMNAERIRTAENLVADVLTNVPLKAQNQFTESCILLAKAVLDGDQAAALPLLDACQEHFNAISSPPSRGHGSVGIPGGDATGSGLRVSTPDDGVA